MCQNNLPSLQREHTIPRKPLRAFEELHADFFVHGGKQFLVTVDAYSGWPTLNYFNCNAPTSKLIEAVRQRFVEKSAPVCFVSDGGPQFTSEEFNIFLKNWNVKHITPSPHYRQSNGLAEACVKTVKKIVRGSWHRGEPNRDYLAKGLLLYCNTPRYNGASPAQLLFGRPIRDLLPAHRRSFEAEWQKSADELERQSAEVKQRVESAFDARSKTQVPLTVGDRVAIQDAQSKKWNRYGVIVEIGRYRDYWTRLASGRVLRRNRRFLRKRLLNLPNDDSPTTAEDVPQVTLPRRSGRIRREPQRLQVDPAMNSYA